jgi:anti-sigma factor RsiW
MSDAWTGRLSEHLDGELSVEDRAELETHVEGCPECRQTLEELRQVAQRAAALEDSPPAESLWPGIAERLGEAAPTEPAVVDLRQHRPTRRRVSFTLPQLAAAGLAVMLLSAGGAWLALSQSGASGGAMPAGPVSAVSGAQAIAVAAADYDAAVAELQDMLTDRRSELDTATVRILEENLAVIDEAIAEAQAALLDDPTNSYLSAHLAAAMWRKVHLLRRAAAIASATG